MKNFNRRAALCGLASLPAGAGAANLPPLENVPKVPGGRSELPYEAAETQGERISRLARQLSAELATYDGGHWEITVRPAIHGREVVQLEPVAETPEALVKRRALSFQKAFEAAHPGYRFRFAVNLENRVAVMQYSPGRV
jgi:hypothetical protein